VPASIYSLHQYAEVHTAGMCQEDEVEQTDVTLNGSKLKQVCNHSCFELPDAS